MNPAPGRPVYGSLIVYILIGQFSFSKILAFLFHFTTSFYAVIILNVFTTKFVECQHEFFWVALICCFMLRQNRGVQWRTDPPALVPSGPISRQVKAKNKAMRLLATNKARARSNIGGPLEDTCASEDDDSVET